MKKYDYLIVGAGLFGAVFAYEAMQRGKTCLVLERRNHIAGNIYCETIEDIHVHKYGAHIFHTSNKQVWDYINQFATFNNYINSPIAVYKDELYNLPQHEHLQQNVEHSYTAGSKGTHCTANRSTEHYRTQESGRTGTVSGWN